MTHKIIIASDGSGRTANQLLKAALTQFTDTKPDVILHSIVRSEEKVEEIIQESLDLGKALIAHTIVNINLKSYLIKKCDSLNINHIDLIGDLVDKLSDILSNEPNQTQGLYYQTNQEYFRRIDAVQFAFKHDDGNRVEEIDKAEIILLGVSRTFKTPLSIYLAYNGFFTANIPIIKGITPPDLSHVNPSKIFCLTMNPNKLSELRTTRNKSFGGYANDYIDIQSIKEELIYASRYYNLHPNWKTIDVTNKPVEEIASEILKLTDIPFSKHF